MCCLSYLGHVTELKFNSSLINEDLYMGEIYEKSIFVLNLDRVIICSSGCNDGNYGIFF